MLKVLVLVLLLLALTVPAAAGPHARTMALPDLYARTVGQVTELGAGCPVVLMPPSWVGWAVSLVCPQAASFLPGLTVIEETVEAAYLGADNCLLVAADGAAGVFCHDTVQAAPPGWGYPGPTVTPPPDGFGIPDPGFVVVPPPDGFGTPDPGIRVVPPSRRH